ncbi:MAG: hypothetical protein GXP63_01160 [DPANN group archaeon]|nr:hypothetical protein [DPANN group archaeon]
MLILLGLVMLLVISLVVVTSYYHSSLSELAERHFTVQQRYDKLIADLQAEKSKLNETMVTVKLKERREQQLSENYQGLREEAATREAQLQNVTTALTSTTMELATTKAQLQDKLKELQTEKLTLINTQAVLSNAQQSLESYDSEVSRLDDRVDAVQAMLDASIADNATSSSCKATLSLVDDSFASVKSSKNHLQSIASSVTSTS